MSGAVARERSLAAEVQNFVTSTNEATAADELARQTSAGGSVSLHLHHHPRSSTPDVLLYSSNVEPQHVKTDDAVNVKAAGSSRNVSSRANLSSADWLVPLLSNQTRGVHVLRAPSYASADAWLLFFVCVHVCLSGCLRDSGGGAADDQLQQDG